MNKKKKPKIYIPTYKIIILCCLVITFCMCLLLITTITSNKKSKPQAQEEEAISQRFEYSEKKELREDITKNFSPEKTVRESENSGKKTEQKNEDKNSDKNKNNKDSKNQQQKNSGEAGKNSNSQTAGNKSSGAKTSETKPVQEKTSDSGKNGNGGKSDSDGKNVPTKTTAVTGDAGKSEGSKTGTGKSEFGKSETSGKNFDFPVAVNNAQLVFVFDDGGQNLAHLNKFLNLPFPITIAVLPRLANSRESAQRIRNAGIELILHQPMQAVNSKVNPGPGAITPEMSEDEIISTLFQNINEISPIAGMNNHEGSAITADAEKMSVIMKIAAENGIYFLDSRTNVETKVPYVASEMGYSYYERNIFLDNTKKREDILNEIKKGLAIANKNGVVIMIGHIWSADVLPGLLEEIYPELKRKGYTFQTVSKSKGKKQ